jgi:hypothetical protein
MRTRALSIVSVFLCGGFIYERSRGTGATHPRSAPGALGATPHLLSADGKVHREPKQFHPLRKNLLENVPEKEIDLERAGKCNLAGHLLSQRTEGVFGNWRVAPPCSESFKSQQVIIGL